MLFFIIKIENNLLERQIMKTLLKILATAFLLVYWMAAFAEKPVKVKIGYSRLRISLPIFVASQKGIFAKNGLDPELVMFDTAQPLADALCGGRIDVAGYTAFPIMFSAQARSKKELYYVTAILEDEKHPISMMIVKKDSSFDSITALRGKKIGILPTVAYKIWLEVILEHNGITPGEVIFQQVAPALTPQALETGLVDAVFTNDPAVTTCLQKGIAKLLTKEALVPKYLDSPFPFASFNLTREFVKQNPVLARKIVLSLDEAIDFIASHQKESKQMMSAFLPDPQKPFVEQYADSYFLKSGEFTEKALISAGEMYQKTGILKEIPDLKEAFYPPAKE